MHNSWVLVGPVGSWPIWQPTGPTASLLMQFFRLSGFWPVMVLGISQTVSLCMSMDACSLCQAVWGVKIRLGASFKALPEAEGLRLGCVMDPPLLQGLGQRRLVHRATPGCVHQEGTLLHLLDGEVVDQVVVVLVEATLQAHAVAVEQQILQGAHPLQPQCPLSAVWQVGVLEEHVEAKGLGPQCHCLPDAT